MLTQLWFRAKSLLLSIAEKQGRHVDAIAIATAGAREASALFCGHFMRAFILSRAKTNYKLGKFTETLSDCNICIKQCEQNFCDDETLLRCLCLKASALRSQNLLTKDASTAKNVFQESLQLLRSARRVSLKLANLFGAFPADSNTIFGAVNSSVADYHAIIPALHGLTELHSNEPNLTLYPSFDSKKLRQAYEINLRKQDMGSNELFPVSAQDDLTSLSDLRLGPVDADETTFSPSCFVNIYLSSVRYLIICHASLCLLIGDARRSGYFPSTYNELLNEEVLLGENGIKVGPFNFYPSISIRCCDYHNCYDHYLSYWSFYCCYFS